MPILPVEPDCYPADLIDKLNPLECVNRAWWVLHTKPRQEKSLARALHAAEIPFFLPLVPRRLVVRGKLMHSYSPLFPGYLFLLAGGEERQAALGTGRIVQALTVVEQDRLWGDLQQLHRLILTGQPIQSEDRLVAGRSVEIRSGPLAGMRGKIVHGAARDRFVVEVDFIQRGASVLLEGHMLAAIAG